MNLTHELDSRPEGKTDLHDSYRIILGSFGRAEVTIVLRMLRTNAQHIYNWILRCSWYNYFFLLRFRTAK